MIERIYNISLSKIYSLGKHTKRARRAVKYVKEFICQHMKTQEDKVVLGSDVNELIWRNGIERPPRKLRLKMMKDNDGTVIASIEGAVTADVKKEAKAEKKTKTKKTKPKKEATPAKAEGKKPADEKAK